MKHAMLGAGAVGGLVGVLLANAGEDVTLIVRCRSSTMPESLKLLRPDSSSLTKRLRTVESLTENDEIDVLWVATRAMDLTHALKKNACLPRAVIPLLNGVDHVQTLSDAFGRDKVIPATIAVEVERAGSGVIRQVSPFVRLRIAVRGAKTLDRVAEALQRQGVDLEFEPNESLLLWSKLAFIAPFALTTSASGLAAGPLREDAKWFDVFEKISREVAEVARAQGAEIHSETAVAMLQRVQPEMRSSMSKDILAGRKTEIDAIAVSVVRIAAACNVSVPTLRNLTDQLSERQKAAARPAT